MPHSEISSPRGACSFRSRHPMLPWGHRELVTANEQEKWMLKSDFCLDVAWHWHWPNQVAVLSRLVQGHVTPGHPLQGKGLLPLVTPRIRPVGKNYCGRKTNKKGPPCANNTHRWERPTWCTESAQGHLLLGTVLHAHLGPGDTKAKWEWLRRKENIRVEYPSHEIRSGPEQYTSGRLCAFKP